MQDWIYEIPLACIAGCEWFSCMITNALMPVKFTKTVRAAYINEPSVFDGLKINHIYVFHGYEVLRKSFLCK